MTIAQPDFQFKKIYYALITSFDYSEERDQWYFNGMQVTH